MTTHLRVLVVEDDSRVSALITTILAEAGFSYLTVADTAARAASAIRSATPELMLVDLGLPDRDGVELIRQVRSEGHLALPILVLSSATGPERVLAALEEGADGYLFKEDLRGGLASALREVARGGLPLSRGAARAVLGRLRGLGGGARPAVLPALTARERDVLSLLSTGAKYAEIGAELGIGTNTVRSHIRSLYDKCGVQNGAEAVNLAWHLGLLERHA